MVNERTAVLTAILLTAGAFLFYLLTLAPTVLWGDDAFFQWSAAANYLQPDGGGHWLHFQLARLFLHLPLGDIAYRVNLVSAVFATLTVFLIYLTGRALNLSNLAAAAAALSLAVSHTFWTHAVRAEVYSVFTFMLSLILWLVVTWTKKRPSFIITAAFLIGPALLSHQMTLLILPALLLLLWLRRSWLNAKIWLLAAAAFISGLLIAAFIIHQQVQGHTLFNSITTYFTQSGTDFSSAILSISPRQLPADLALWLGMLGLQFVGPAIILCPLALPGWRKIPPIWLGLLIFYLTTVIFAATYRVNDRFVFFLPGYLIVALFVGRGWDRLRQKRPSLAKLSLPLLLFTPIITYAILPPVMNSIGLSIPGARTLPGREPVAYFLWPAKSGYTAAAEFGRTALATLPPNAVLLADHTPYQTLYYIQRVEEIRPDIRLIKIEPGQDLAPLINTIPSGQPIFLADNNPRYYNVTSLPGSNLIPIEPVYRLE